MLLAPVDLRPMGAQARGSELGQLQDRELDGRHLFQQLVLEPKVKKS
jgi:hypothetical protein